MYLENVMQETAHDYPELYWFESRSYRLHVFAIFVGHLGLFS